MAYQELTLGQVQQIQDLIYGITSNPDIVLTPSSDKITTQSDKLDWPYRTILTKIWDFLKEVYTETEIEAVRHKVAEFPELKDQEKEVLLILNVGLLKKINYQAEVDSIQEMSARYKQALAEKQIEIKAVIATHPSAHDQVKQAISTTINLLARDHSDLSQTIQAAQSSIEVNLLLKPERTTAEMVSYVISTTKLTAEESIAYVRPLVEPIIVLQPTVDNLTATIINDLGDKIPIEAAREISNKIVAYKIYNPAASAQKIQAFIESNIQVQVEAAGITLVIPTDLSQRVAEHNLSAAGPELVQQTIACHLNVSSPDAQLLIKNGYAQTTLAAIQYHKTNSHTNVSQKKAYVNATLDATSQLARSFLQSKNRVVKAARSRRYTNFNTLAEVLEQEYGYQNLESVYRNHDSNPFAQYVLSTRDYVLSYAKDYGTTLTLDALVRGPLGKWIIPNEAISGIYFDTATAADIAAIKPLTGAATTLVKTGVAEAAASGAAVSAEGAAGATAATGAATGTGIGATITTFLIGLGIPAPLVNFVIAAIAAAVAFIVKHAKQIWKWLENRASSVLKFLAVLGTGLGAVIFGAITYIIVGFLGLAGLPQVGVAILAAAGGSVLVGGVSTLVNIGDFIHTLLVSIVEFAIVEIAFPIIITLLIAPIVVALFLFIINTSALLVPVNKNPFNNQNNFVPPGEKIECMTTTPPLGLSTPTNPIAAQALHIVNNLKQGFWCYWNNSPDYPNLFNYQEYNLYPYHCVYRPNNPPGCSGGYSALDGNALFWCTWLVMKSLAVANITPPSFELGANNMMTNWFINKGKFTRNGSGLITLTNSKVKPGDIAFISTGSDPSGNPSTTWAGHVAIVYAVTSEFVLTLDSNAGTRTHAYTVDTNGALQSINGLAVLGFGRLP